MVDYSKWDRFEDEIDHLNEEGVVLDDSRRTPVSYDIPAAPKQQCEEKGTSIDWISGTILYKGEWVFLDQYAPKKHGLLDQKRCETTSDGRIPPVREVRSSGPKGRHAVATRRVEAGELLFSCSGVAVVKAESAARVCAHCFAGCSSRSRGSSVKVQQLPVACSDCGLAHYCSQSCATQARPTHAPLCEALATLTEACPQLPFHLDVDTARLALHILHLHHHHSHHQHSHEGNSSSSSSSSSGGEGEEKRPLLLPIDLESHREKVGDEQCREALAGGAVLLRLLGIVESPKMNNAHSTAVEEDDAGVKLAELAELAGARAEARAKAWLQKQEAEAAELLLQIRFNAHPVDSLLRTTSSTAAAGDGGSLSGGIDGRSSGGRVGAMLPGALLGLFPAAARLNHSCLPNATLSWQEKGSEKGTQLLAEKQGTGGVCQRGRSGGGIMSGNNLDGRRDERSGGGQLVCEVRCTLPLKQGEEVCFSYLTDDQLVGGGSGSGRGGSGGGSGGSGGGGGGEDTHTPRSGRAARRELLRKGFLFDCSCVRCQQRCRRKLSSTGCMKQRGNRKGLNNSNGSISKSKVNPSAKEVSAARSFVNQSMEHLAKETTATSTATTSMNPSTLGCLLQIASGNFSSLAGSRVGSGTGSIGGSGKGGRSRGADGVKTDAAGCALLCARQMGNQEEAAAFAATLGADRFLELDNGDDSCSDDDSNGSAGSDSGSGSRSGGDDSKADGGDDESRGGGEEEGFSKKLPLALRRADLLLAKAKAKSASAGSRRQQRGNGRKAAAAEGGGEAAAFEGNNATTIGGIATAAAAEAAAEALSIYSVALGTAHPMVELISRSLPSPLLI